MSREESDKPTYEIFGEVTIEIDEVYPVNGPDPKQVYVEDEDLEPGGQYKPISDGDVDYDIILLNLTIIMEMCAYSGWDVQQFLPLTIIHEYCHWGLTEEENAELMGDKEHSYDWNSLLVELLEYVSDEDLPRESIEPGNKVHFGGEMGDPSERNVSSEPDAPF